NRRLVFAGEIKPQRYVVQTQRQQRVAWIEPDACLERSEPLLRAAGKDQGSASPSVCASQVRGHCKRPLGLSKSAFTVATVQQHLAEKCTRFRIRAGDARGRAHDCPGRPLLFGESERQDAARRCLELSIGKASVASAEVRV